MSEYVERINDHYISNGSYQKLAWLGVNGFLIINEIDKEILMIDPWPSYSKEAVENSVKVDQLIEWLKHADKNGYKLIGIIGTHEHFDHIEDIPVILNKLYYEINPKNGFPPIYSDLGTFEEIKKVYSDLYGITVNRNKESCLFEDLFPYFEFKYNNTHLYYDDLINMKKKNNNEINYPLIAGTKLDQISIGNYWVTPYIWDHVSTNQNFNTLSGNMSGNYQRCTALFLEHKNDPEHKRLFIIGSAGEMAGEYTTNITIETDILIQAVPHKVITDSNYTMTLNGVIDYHFRNIIVKDRIIASHFETFVHIDVPVKKIGLLATIFAPLLPFIPSLQLIGTVAMFVPDINVKKISCFYGDLEKEENQNRIIEYASRAVKLNSSINNGITKIYYLNRFLIEYGLKIVVEHEDGYQIHNESILEHTTSLPPIDNYWENEYYIFITKCNIVLLFKHRYLYNPHTKEVHDLKKASITFDSRTIFYESSLCNIHLMNFLKMKYFKTNKEAIDILNQEDSLINGCAHCLKKYNHE